MTGAAMRYHGLTTDQLRALSSGVGGPDVMDELVTSRISLHLMLLKNVADRWAADRGALAAAVRVLARVQDYDPPLYAELIGDPLVGAWLTRTSQLAQPGEAAFLHFGGLAAAAALRAGRDTGADATLTGYAERGRLVLPTFGEALFGTPVTGPVTVTVDAGGKGLTDAAGTALVPRPSRRLRAAHQGLAISVRLEDSNPYRDGYHAPPSERLSEPEVAHWQNLFADAWRLLVDCLPQWATEIARMLRAVVPLVEGNDGSSRSGTARESVGAMCLSRPRTAADLAVTLVHEVHHSKLSAVLDMVPLYRSGGAERHRVPWKRAPRPTSGLIQGVYAFLGVADAWHHLSAVPALTAVASRQFASIRAQVAAGMAALESSTELTGPGREFTAGMRIRLDELLDRPVR